MAVSSLRRRQRIGVVEGRRDPSGRLEGLDGTAVMIESTVGFLSRLRERVQRAYQAARWA
jgi:hypothetical protein